MHGRCGFVRETTNCSVRRASLCSIGLNEKCKRQQHQKKEKSNIKNNTHKHKYLCSFVRAHCTHTLARTSSIFIGVNHSETLLNSFIRRHRCSLARMRFVCTLHSTHWIFYSILYARTQTHTQRTHTTHSSVISSPAEFQTNILLNYSLVCLLRSSRLSWATSSYEHNTNIAFTHSSSSAVRWTLRVYVRCVYCPAHALYLIYLYTFRFVYASPFNAHHPKSQNIIPSTLTNSTHFDAI